MRENGKIAPGLGYTVFTGQRLGGAGLGSMVTVVSLPVWGSFITSVIGCLGGGLLASYSIFLS